MMNYFHRFIIKSQRIRDLRRSREVGFLIRNQGQALIEYLLMVVVAVVLLVGLTLAFFQPLGNFLTRLNDVYIRCLLETGELPKTRTDSVASCDASIPTFQTNNMDGSVPTPEQRSGRGAENARGESSSADGSSGSDIGNGGTSSGGRASVRKSSLIRNGMRQNGGARAEGGENKTTNIPVDDFQAGEGFANNSSGGYSVSRRQKTKKIALSGLTEYDRKKIEREAEKTRSIAVDSESFTQKKNKKITVKPPVEKPPNDELNVKTDFGDYFKIFFFIVIILFIIILMGSQAMQMTNNSDS